MFDERLKNTLKNFKQPIYSKQAVSEIFPKCLMQYLCSYSVTNIYGKVQHIAYDSTKSYEFVLRLGGVIYHDTLDLLDDIVIDFVKTYHYKVVTPKVEFVMFPVNFPESEEIKFRTICNNFKGRAWNDILPEFVDALYDFVNTATIHGDDLICTT